nr:hypothetical protein [Nocardia cyriacigeorgica]
MDTLLSAETGRAALELYRQHRGVSPITAIGYNQ